MPYCPQCGSEVDVVGGSCAKCSDKAEGTRLASKVPSQFTNTIKQRTRLGSDVRTPLELKKTKSLGAPEQTLQQSEKEGWKGKLLLAVVLNVLWAGVGNMAVKAPKGGMIAAINIVAYILAIATGGILVVPPLALFIWSTALAYQHLRYPAKSPDTEPMPNESTQAPYAETATEIPNSSDSTNVPKADLDSVATTTNETVLREPLGSEFPIARWSVSVILNFIWPGIGNLIFKQWIGILIAVLNIVYLAIPTEDGGLLALAVVWMIGSRIWAITILYRRLKHK